MVEASERDYVRRQYKMDRRKARKEVTMGGASICNLLLDCVLARTVWAACLRWWDREDRLPPRGISLADWLQF
jgi:hypothetical protein